MSLVLSAFGDRFPQDDNRIHDALALSGDQAVQKADTQPWEDKTKVAHAAIDEKQAVVSRNEV